jgi:hypothetical protein
MKCNGHGVPKSVSQPDMAEIAKASPALTTVNAVWQRPSITIPGFLAVPARGSHWDMVRKEFAVGFLSVLVWSTPFQASSPPKKYKNCTVLKKVYPRGVTVSAASAGSKGATVSTEV